MFFDLLFHARTRAWRTVPACRSVFLSKMYVMRRHGFLHRVCRDGSLRWQLGPHLCWEGVRDIGYCLQRTVHFHVFALRLRAWAARLDFGVVRVVGPIVAIIVMAWRALFSPQLSPRHRISCVPVAQHATTIQPPRRHDVAGSPPAVDITGGNEQNAKTYLPAGQANLKICLPWFYF